MNSKQTEMKNVPKKIYLQVDADGETPEDFSDLAGVSWCADKINDNDIEYVLASLPSKPVGDVEEMDRVIKCLALELPEPVWNDVNKKWQGFKSGYAAAQQSGDEPTLTIQQALEVWEDACKDLLKDIAQVFLDKSNQAKADTLRDADVFQAVGETIENFPLRDKRTYFLNKFGIDIDKM